MAERPEDLNLPNAVITRLIKDSLPEGIVVAKEARSAIAKAASVFVLYTTSTANNLAQKNKKKTVSAQDVFNAMKEMEFEKFIDPLQESLDLYKKSMQSKKEQKEAKAKAKKEEEKKATSNDDKKTSEGEQDSGKLEDKDAQDDDITTMETDDATKESSENGIEIL